MVKQISNTLTGSAHKSGIKFDPTVKACFISVCGVESYLKNCFVKFRDGDAGPLFVSVPMPGVDGEIWGLAVRLDGYAVVPKEEYEVLLKAHEATQAGASTQPPIFHGAAREAAKRYFSSQHQSADAFPPTFPNTVRKPQHPQADALTAHPASEEMLLPGLDTALPRGSSPELLESSQTGQIEAARLLAQALQYVLRSS